MADASVQACAVLGGPLLLFIVSALLLFIVSALRLRKLANYLQGENTELRARLDIAQSALRHAEADLKRLRRSAARDAALGIIEAHRRG
jgi:hypothetical protein